MALIETKDGDVRFAYVYDGNERVGDVTLFPDGTATVMNEWSGMQQWFESDTGHEDALHYIKTRMAEQPRFIG